MEVSSDTKADGDGPAAVELPCWDSAEVDPDADFKGVTAVFGYGSLVWKPPCDAEYIGTATIGCIRGWARRFWQHSVDHRGTSTAPGRVATILHRTHPDMAVAATARATRAAGASAADGRGHGDGHGDDADGGSVPPTGPTELVTAGMVYTITDMATILPMLDFREKNGYTRTVVDVFDPENLDRKINRAIMYYAKPGRDPAYLGKLTNDDIAATVASAVGPSGPNVDYVLNLDRWCRQNGVDDDHVSEVSRLTRERMA